MQIEIRKSAIKDLKQISEPFKTKIHNKILELKKFPNLQNIKKLTNFEPAYRLRIGDYRVVFYQENDLMLISRIAHRKGAFEIVRKNLK